MSDKTIRILVTGDHDDANARLPETLPDDNTRLEWVSLPVLRFERLPIPADLVERLIHKPVEWILFTSPRAVQFWSEVLMEYGHDFPLETQVACIGEKTAQAAEADGFTPDFYPTEPGTEVFLEEFEDLISNNSIKPSVFIPQAEAGRDTIRNRLRELGCEVETVALYRTLPREDLRQALTQAELDATACVLFTSPSSFDAFTSAFAIPANAKVASIGHYTSRHLAHKGFADAKTLPQGDFSRIAEVLK